MTESVERYYIPAPEVPVPERLIVLKHDETFGLFNDFGDIDAHARPEEGLYNRGTRFLSRLTLKLLGARPLLLSSAVHRDNLLMSADLTNPDVYVDGHVILPRGSLHVYRSKLIRSDTCHERIHLRNFINEPLDITLAFEFSADYADIFEIRGQHRPRRGRLLEPRAGANFVILGYEGLDGIERLRNLRRFCHSSMLADMDLSRLAGLDRLESVSLGDRFASPRTLLALPSLKVLECYPDSIDDPTVIPALEANGVKVTIFC